METKNGGDTWEQSGSLAENSRAIREADVASENFNNIFISVARSNEEEIMYYSLDGGKTFTAADTRVNFFRYDPHNSRGMRLLGFNIYAQPDDIFESLDGGKIWQAIGKLPKEATNDERVSNIVWDPKDDSVIYLNGDMGRVWKSVDGMKSWTLLLSVEKLG